MCRVCERADRLLYGGGGGGAHDTSDHMMRNQIINHNSFSLCIMTNIMETEMFFCFPISIKTEYHILLTTL